MSDAAPERRRAGRADDRRRRRVDNEKYFCELDAVVGDGDFGYSLARGFEMVLADWDAIEYDDVGGAAQEDRRSCSPSRVGGTSGPIWGTAFLRARRRRCTDKTGADGGRRRRDAPRRDRGHQAARRVGPRRQDPARRARPGDRRARAGARGRRRARRTRSRRPPRPRARAPKATKGMLAKRGRAAYTGERSTESRRRRRGRRRGDVRARQRRLAPDDRRGRRDRARRRSHVKKFVNDPKQFVPEMLKGIELANPGTLQVRARVQPDHADGRPARRQGVDHPGLGLRPRARARDDRRQGHARRRLSGRRVRRAAHRTTSTRRRKLLNSPEGRAAHHQQLHRRPHGLRHGRASWPRPRASRSAR